MLTFRKLGLLQCYLRNFERIKCNGLVKSCPCFHYHFGLPYARYSTLKNMCLLNNQHLAVKVRNYAKKAQGKMLKSGKAKSVHLTDEEMSEVINVAEYQNELLQVKQKLQSDYIEHISLRSAAGNIENILVKVENEEYPLQELAQISKKNQNLIAINMSDFSEALKPAMQAIIDSGSGMNPQQDGTMIYVSVPKLTREHRENLAKNARSLFVKAKEEIKNVQNYYVKEAKRKDYLSKDLVFNACNQIMAIAENCCEELEKMLKAKQKELLGEK